MNDITSRCEDSSITIPLTESESVIISICLTRAVDPGTPAIISVGETSTPGTPSTITASAASTPGGPATSTAYSTYTASRQLHQISVHWGGSNIGDQMNQTREIIRGTTSTAWSLLCGQKQTREASTA